jgi:hypothetical protein
MGILGVYPWRCQHCHSRFYSRLMPLSFMFRAHCPHCGNLEVRRISPEFVNTPLGGVWRRLNIPALRCDPCRHKYFSILPVRESAEPFYNTSPAD